MTAVPYRLRQASKALGGALNSSQRAEIAPVLGPRLLPLFLTMGPLGQRHGYDAYRTLLARGERHPDLLAAGLLHDAGKGRLGVPARAAWVLLGALSPALRARLARAPLFGNLLGFAQNLHHAEQGARAAACAGGSETLVRLIRDHKAQGAGDPLLLALQSADDDN
jgi:hypothetical protein